MSLKLDGSRIKPELAVTIGQWVYVWCQTYIQFPSHSGVQAFFSYECAACGNTNLRFEHILEHKTTGRQIVVGLDCACALLDDDELPRLAENEVKRKERWRIFYKKRGRCIADREDLEKRGVL